MNYSRVVGATVVQPAACDVNFWVMDVETQQVLVSTGLIPGLYSPEATPITWDMDAQSISFYEFEDLRPNGYYFITMYFDGRVIKQPISRERYNSVVNLPELPDYLNPNLLDSPSGQSIIRSGGEQGTRFENRFNGETIPIPPHSDAAGRVLDAKWHPREQWVILGYERCFADCTIIGGATVMSMDGSTVRELGECGFSDSCIGWLPDYVDLSVLPPGAAAVRPARADQQRLRRRVQKLVRSR